MLGSVQRDGCWMVVWWLWRENRDEGEDVDALVGEGACLSSVQLSRQDARSDSLI